MRMRISSQCRCISCSPLEVHITFIPKGPRFPLALFFCLKLPPAARLLAHAVAGIHQRATPIGVNVLINRACITSGSFSIATRSHSCGSFKITRYIKIPGSTVSPSPEFSAVARGYDVRPFRCLGKKQHLIAAGHDLIGKYLIGVHRVSIACTVA